MRSRIAIIMLLVICLCCCVSCRQVPGNVKDKEHFSNSEISISPQYISPSELNSTSAEALRGNYNQIRLENIQLSLPTQLSEVGFEQISGFEKEYEKLFSSAFGSSVLSTEKIQKVRTPEPDDMLTYQFRNDDKKIYGCVGDNGFFTFIKPDCYDDPYAYDCETVKIIHVDRNEPADDVYELLDGKLSVSDAITYAREWLNKNYAEYEKDFDMNVKTVIVRKAQKGYCFDITAEKRYMGTPLDELALISDPKDPKTLKYTVSKLKLTMHRKHDISSFTNGCGIIRPIKKGTVDKLISLETALKKCQDKFTAHNEIRISSISLKYTIEPIYDTDDKYVYYHAGRKFVSHILWEFVIDVPHDRLKNKGEKDTHGDVRKYIYVDAQT
ncbi:MAG: hypothetical protein II574_04020, partial [Ruminococcus sp.]|nr:hypothetical protein [Ruminococcus sp.]